MQILELLKNSKGIYLKFNALCPLLKINING